MRIREKEKNILIDAFVKTAEFVMSIVVLGQIVAGTFRLMTFLTGPIIFVSLILAALLVSSTTKE